MVDRRPKLLQDIFDAGSAIQLFAQGKSASGYRADLMFRSAVERQFEIIGEALRGIEVVDPRPLFVSAKATLPHPTPFAISLNANFWILPVDVFGSGPNTIVFGTL